MQMEQLILLFVALVLVTVIFYVSGALVGRDWTLTGGYLVRLLLVALLAVFVIPIFRSATNTFELGEIGLLLAFVILIIAVRYLMIDELSVSEEWLASIVVSIVGVLLIYAVDAVADWLFDIRLLELF